MNKTAPRRLRWLIPALLVIGWLAIGGFGGPFAGKLSEVAKNDNAAFLPRSAEATEVSDEQKAFTPRQVLPATVVAERTSGLTGEDRRFLADKARQLGTVPGVVGPLGQPQPAPRDNQAVQLAVPILADGNPADVVKEVRAQLAYAPDGLTVLVTGPAGQIADLVTAFGGIDGILLLVAAWCGRADPDRRLPQPAAAVPGAALGGVRARAREPRRLPAGEERHPRAQRPEPGHPLDPRVRRGDRLRPADGRAVPRAAARHPEPVRRAADRVARHARTDRRVGGHRRARGAVPAVQRPELQQGPRPGRRDRHRRRAAGVDDVPARRARAVRPRRVLAVQARARLAAPGDRRDLGPGGPAWSASGRARSGW